MRLWSLHPKYLDPAGLVACWREALLAKHVLSGKTKGYKHHPQLIRFREHKQPLAAINTYLMGIFEEASQRGYHFDETKIGAPLTKHVIPVSKGQVVYEWSHLSKKLRERNPGHYKKNKLFLTYDPHPLFKAVPGPVAPWEKM